MRAMPRRFASRTPCNVTASPSIRISPASGKCAPARIFMKVLFPAPFSPMTAKTSPALRDSETSASATTPGNRLVTALTASRGLGSVSAIRSVVQERLPLSSFFQLGQLLRERGDVGLVYHLDSGVDNPVRRQGCFGGIPFGRQVVHPLGRQITEHEGLLHDADLDGSTRNPVERSLVLVEYSRKHLSLLAHTLEARGDGRTFVVPHPHHHAEVRVRIDDVLDAGPCLATNRVVFALVDDADAVGADDVFDAFPPLRVVVCRERPHEHG